MWVYFWVHIKEARDLLPQNEVSDNEKNFVEEYRMVGQKIGLYPLIYKWFHHRKNFEQLTNALLCMTVYLKVFEQYKAQISQLEGRRGGYFQLAINSTFQKLIRAPHKEKFPFVETLIHELKNSNYYSDEINNSFVDYVSSL